MARFNVSDEIGGHKPQPNVAWSWDRTTSCSARMIIEERIRSECDRIASGHPATELFLEISDGVEAFSEKIVERGVNAFAAGKILLIVNDGQVLDLDAPILLQAANEAIFLKIVPLRGG
jgi:hypothetical protein